MGLIPIFQNKEKRDIAYKVNNMEAGHGTLHKGKYYNLCYEPVHNERDFKCTGVKLTFHPTPDAMYINHNFQTYPITVQFKPGRIFNRGAYSTRLERAVNICKKRIEDVDILIDTNREKKAKAIRDAHVWELTDTEDREKAIVEHVKKINMCQMRIDATMKKKFVDAEPGVKSVIEPKPERDFLKPRVWVQPVMPDDKSVDDCPLRGHAGVAGVSDNQIKR
jgi:hypothetical protein